MPNPSDMFNAISEAVGTGEPEADNSKALTVSSYEPKLAKLATEFKGKGAIDGQDLPDDYTFARENLQDIVESGQIALQSAIEVAACTGNPELFNAVASLMKSTSDAAKQLLAAHHEIEKIRLTKKKISEPSPKSIEAAPGSTNVQQNIYFSGSTADMISLLQEGKKQAALDGHFIEVDSE